MTVPTFTLTGTELTLVTAIPHAGTVTVYQIGRAHV